MKRLLIFILLFIPVASLFAQGKIYTTNNKVIDCSYIQNKRFGVEYIAKGNSDGTRDYLAHSKIDRIEYENGDIEYISGSPTKDHKNRTKKDPKDFTYLSPNYVAVNIGAAFAIPQVLGYGSTYAGQLTQTGPNVYIDGMFNPDIFSGFGIAGYVGYNYNPIDPTAFYTTLQSQLPSNATNVSFQNTGWNNICFLGGGDYYLEIGRLMLEAKIMLGGLYSFHPTATATFDTSGITKTATLKTQDLFFCYGGQLTARYFITRKLSIKASLSAMLSRGGFSAIKREDYQGSNLVYQSTIGGPFNANISWIGLSFGVAYTIGK